MKNLLILALVLAGCGIVDPCTDRERSFELIYADGPAFDRDMATLLELGRAGSGWTCAETGKIRNAFGGEIGVRWRCTTCN